MALPDYFHFLWKSITFFHKKVFLWKSSDLLNPEVKWTCRYYHSQWFVGIVNHNGCVWLSNRPSRKYSVWRKYCISDLYQRKIYNNIYYLIIIKILFIKKPIICANMTVDILCTWLTHMVELVTTSTDWTWSFSACRP